MYEMDGHMEFNMDEFQQAIKTTKRKAGQGMPPFVIKVAERFHQTFLKAINFWMREGIPEEVLLANLWLLYKKGDRMDAGSYRPISIPHPLYNTIARLILHSIKNKVEKKLYKHQYGFRTGYSCTEAIMVYRAKVKEYLNAYPGEGTSSLFIDLMKAFDSVPHHLLFEQLGKYLEFEELKALSFLYNDGTIGIPTVNPQDQKKAKRKYVQKVGVRQGCPLSPLLFALYINSTLSEIQNSSSELLAFLSAFADDVECTAPNDHLPHMAAELEKGFNSLKLKISVPKSVLVRLDEEADGRWSTVKIYGQEIPVRETFKYLGCFINKSPKAMLKTVYEEHTQWLAHITALPLTFQERLKLINTVGIARLSFRLAPLLDLVGNPKYTMGRESLESLEKGGKASIFDKVEKAHKQCLLEVSGVSGFVVDKTLYSRQPQGYGLRHTWTVTLGMGALAHSKICSKNSNTPQFLDNPILVRIGDIIESHVRRAGGQCFGDPPQTKLEHITGLPPQFTDDGTNLWEYDIKEFRSIHPDFPKQILPIGQIYCDGSMNGTKMAGGVVTTHTVLMVTCQGLPSSYRAEISALLLACKIAGHKATIWLDNNAVVKKVNGLMPP